MNETWTGTQFPPEFPDKYVARNKVTDQVIVKSTLVLVQNELTALGYTRQEAHVAKNSSKTESFRLRLSRLPKDQAKQAPAILETWA